MDKHVGVFIPQELLDEIKSYCLTNGMTEAELYSYAVDDYVTRELKALEVIEREKKRIKALEEIERLKKVVVPFKKV